MSLAVFGDPHVSNFARHGAEKVCGINRRGRLTLDTLERGLQKAAIAGCSTAVIVGDLLDSMVTPPQVVAELRRILDDSGLSIHVLRGNHDCSSDLPMDDALHVLSSPNVFIEDVPRREFSDNIELLLIPFRSGKIAKWLPEVLDNLLVGAPVVPGARPRIIFIHAGIKDKDTAPWLQESPGAIRLDSLQELMVKHGIDLCFSGDWHENKVWGPVHQVGALCPVGYSNLGISEYGQVPIVSRAGAVKYISIPGPRFLKYGPDGDPSTLSAGDGNTYFVEWSVRFEDFEAAQARLRALIASGVVADGSVLVQEESSAEVSSGGAERAADVPEAASKFVDDLILHGIDKASVLLRALRYLGI